MSRALFGGGDIGRRLPGWAAGPDAIETARLQAEIARLKTELGSVAMLDVSYDLGLHRPVTDEEVAMLGEEALEGASSS